MDIDVLAKYAKYFGLGVKTGVELPSEVAGSVASRETAEKNNHSWQPGDMMSAVIGQSYNAFTPLQMAKYISMVANGGNKITPTIVESVIRADGTEVPKEEVEQTIKAKLGITDDGTEDLTISQTSIYFVYLSSTILSVLFCYVSFCFRSAICYPYLYILPFVMV